MTTADPYARHPLQARGQPPLAGRTDLLAHRATGTRRAGTLSAGVALTAGLVAGGVATALAVSRSTTEEGAAGSAPAGQGTGGQGASPWEQSGQQGADQGRLIGPGSGPPDGSSHGS